MRLAEGLLQRNHEAPLFTKRFSRQLWNEYPAACGAVKTFGASFSYSTSWKSLQAHWQFRKKAKMPEDLLRGLLQICFFRPTLKHW